MDKIIISNRMSIKPLQIKNVDEYIYDLDNIALANINQLDNLFYRQFFNEACQMIVNGIRIFEKGYFDCAFYSLRQSIEVTIGSLFLSTSPKSWEGWNENLKKYEKVNMLKCLDRKNDEYKDISKRLAPFFTQLKEYEEKIVNKYIHKQGITFFHCYRNGADGYNSNIDNTIINDFEKYIKMSIGAVSLYRLVFDPLPIILMDETLAMKSIDTMVEPFSEPFVKEYIGNDVIEQYKQTDIYKVYKEWFLEQETQCKPIYDIIHYQDVDITKIEIINKQKHMLSLYDKIAVDLFNSSNKISLVYGMNGFLPYTSNIARNDKYIGFTCGNNFFSNYFKSNCDYNCNFDHQDYISRVSFNEDYIYLEHNFVFDDKEIEVIKSVIKQYIIN
jgi:hypothetical protein